MAQGTLSVKDAIGATQLLAMAVDLAGNEMPMHSLDSSQQTYRASASFTPQATAAVTVATLTGSSTKTVRVHRVWVSGTAIALSSTLFGLHKTTALGVGGTAVVPAVAKLDSQSAAATAVAQVWTTTLKAAGTSTEGPLTQVQLFQSTVTTPTVAFCESQTLFPEKGSPIGQAIVLRGVSEFLEIQNLNGGNLAAGSIFQVNFEWVEDNS